MKMILGAAESVGQTSTQVLAYMGAVVGSLGALAASILTLRGHKQQVRADAADLMTQAAGRVARLNMRLDRENAALRKHLMDFADTADDYLHKRAGQDELARAVREVRTEYG